MTINNGPDQELNSTLGNQQRVSGKDSTDTSKEQAADQPLPWSGAVGDAFEEPAGNDEEHDHGGGTKHPDEELLPDEKLKELVQIMRRLGKGAEYANQHSAGCDEQSPDKGVASKGFAQNDGSADGVEDETGLGLISPGSGRIWCTKDILPAGWREPGGGGW